MISGAVDDTYCLWNKKEHYEYIGKVNVGHKIYALLMYPNSDMLFETGDKPFRLCVWSLKNKCNLKKDYEDL